MKHVVWLLIVAATLAGCLNGDGDGANGIGRDDCVVGGVDADGVRLVDPMDPDVIPLEADPWDHDAVNLRTCSLETVGRHPLRFAEDGSPDPHKYLGEIDMRGDLNLGAVAVLGNGEDPGIYILDITDRANPEVLSHIPQWGTYVVDIKWSDDGRYLFAASQDLPSIGELGTLDPITNPQAQQGFTVYDTSNPSNPQYVTTVANVDNIGCHMLSYAYIDDTHVVFCVGNQVNIWGLAEVGGTLVPLGFIPFFPDALLPTPIPLGLPCGPAVVGDPTGQLCSGPHDMTITWDEQDQRRYMVVSHWNSGLYVVDVTNPISEGIQQVGAWAGEGAKHYDGVVHTAMMFTVGEDRYIVATPELTFAGTVPAIWVLDANDLGDLQLVAEWYHPTEPINPRSLLLTLHQWQVAPTGPDVDPEDVRIYITYNRAGIWVLEWERILAGDLWGAIGGFHMAREPLEQGVDVNNAVLATWDVNVVDGYIYGSDRATGLWIFHYEKDELGDPARSGFA